MRIRGRRQKEEKIRHPKKDLDIKNHTNEAIDFEDFITELRIDYRKYKKILEILLTQVNNHTRDRFEDQNLYEYLRRIIYKLATYGFTFTDIEYFFANKITSASIGKWAKEFKREPFRQKPIQVEKECILNLSETHDNKTIEDLTEIRLKSKIYLYHIHKNKFLTIKEAINLKKESRKK